MRLFKQEDPLRAQKKAITRKMRRLEGRMRALSGGDARGRGPRLRSSVRPYGDPVAHVPGELVFEPVEDSRAREARPEGLEVEKARYNENGVRKLDLARLWRRFFRDPARQSHSRLVDYLASGSFQGTTRPLRYERRIARNRLLLFLFFLLMILFGLLSLLQNGTF